MFAKVSQTKESVSDNTSSPLLISPINKSWRFEVVLDRIYESDPKPKEPKLLAVFQLPLNNRLQLRLNYGRYCQGEPNSVTFYYDILLLESTFYPLKIAAAINHQLVIVNRVLAYRSDRESMVDIVAAKPFHLASISAYVQGSYHYRVDEQVKVVLTAYFDLDTIPHANSGNTHANQLATLLSSGKYADCKVVSTDGSSYDCHKAILSLKSEVIEKAFETKQLAEAQNSQIQLDCNDVILDLILPYFYSGNLPSVTTELAIELHRVSHLYQIEGLTVYLADQLLLKTDQLVTTTNVLEFVVYADQVELTEVKRFCLQLISQNRHEIVKQPKWKEFRLKHGDLVDQLLLL